MAKIPTIVNRLISCSTLGFYFSYKLDAVVKPNIMSLKFICYIYVTAYIVMVNPFCQFIVHQSNSPPSYKQIVLF